MEDLRKLKENLISQIDAQVKWVQRDSIVFLWAKYNQLSHTIFGNGDLMMANSGLSALNYLSKVNKIIRTKKSRFSEFEPFVTTEGVHESETFRDKFKGKEKTLIPPKRKWDMNEQTAFKLLVKDLEKYGINLGLDEKDSEEAWVQFRNFLTHMNYPRWFISADNTIFTAEEISIPEKILPKLRKIPKCTFQKLFNEKKPHIYMLDPELLIFRELHLIFDYLSNRIMDCEEKFVLDALYEWNLTSY